MKQRLLTILNVSMVSGCVTLGFNIIAPVLPSYALSFSIPLAVVGWSISAFALARMVTDIPAGVTADRFGRKRNMVIGLVLVAASSVLSGTASSYGWLIVGRIVQGIGSAAYVTAATSLVAQISSGEYRGRLMSMHTGLIFAATCFGPAIGGFSAAHFGIRAPFFVYGGFALLGLLATIPLKDTAELSPETGSPIRLKDIPDVFLNRSFILVTSPVFALFFIRGGVRSTLIPLYASLNLGLSVDKIGLLLTVAAVISSIFTFPSGWLSDKVGRKKPMMSCLILSATAIILIPLQNSPGGLMWNMVLYGFAVGLQGSTAAWIADVSPRDKLGTAMGLYRVIGDMGMILGPITVTYIIDYSGQRLLPFLIPAFLALTAAVLIIWAKDPAARKSAPSKPS